ncbi:UNVERIFIED_CONTAM: Retrovirus-related Pol polyprotein from transposon TNT 1-94 [Sesamum angustifolium]|uniref:Retrovirus-related Pol polyprotein from transposon TNT 1-94 n=1 Tax=Sesamum angustifolium TaxID=2727405 RepID=A0AAW2PTX6_9LAMI
MAKNFNFEQDAVLFSRGKLNDSERDANEKKVLDNVKNVAADVILSGERKWSLFVMSVGQAYVKKTSQTDSAAAWHARLGHVGYQMLQQISSKRLLDGLPTLKNVHEDVVCQGCQYGKSHHLPFKMSSNRRTTSLELIHTDLMGPTRTPSCSHNHYVMVLVDDYSRYTWTYFLKEKNEALSKFVEFRNKVEKELGQKVKCLRSDNGGEFMSADFFQYCDNNGIQRQMACPNTPQQNGMAERKLAHLISTSLSWLHDKNLPRKLWAEAIQCACYVINHLPPWPGKEKAPFEILYGVKPDVNYFRVFGSICYVHVPKNNRTKFDAKAKKCIFVGYDTCRKGWRCMDPTTKKSITSKDVVFDEISSWKTVDELPKVAALPDNSEKQIYQNIDEDSESPNRNASRKEGDDDSVRRSLREKRQPVHFNDYEVQLNHCSITSFFLLEHQVTNQNVTRKLKLFRMGNSNAR